MLVMVLTDLTEICKKLAEIRQLQTHCASKLAISEKNSTRFRRIAERGLPLSMLKARGC